MATYPPIHYSDYLRVSELTDLQSRRSEEFGAPAHDEMLFIITHQTYELWFKQILFELDTARTALTKDQVAERDMLNINKHLERITEIQKTLVGQIDILETMTPMDFLEFRDYLYPASGFQSAQFRLIENKLGLDQRLTYNNQDYKSSLSPEDQKPAAHSEQEISLFTLLEKWLERTPFLTDKNFDFWQAYRQAVHARIQESRQHLEQVDLEEDMKAKHLKQIDEMEESFESLFDPERFEKMREKNHWRLSHQALRAALFIYLYRDEPILQQPFHLLQNLQAIDEGFTQWRYRHALMVHRMIGVKMGTGGSSGHKYLKAASDKHKIFSDLNNLATFFLPKSSLPQLPKELLSKLNFHY